jgi:threonine dehydratase
MFENILAAKKRLKGHAHVTPIMVSRTLNRMVGAEVFFKCENFQRIGAFQVSRCIQQYLATFGYGKSIAA